MDHRMATFQNHEIHMPVSSFFEKIIMYSHSHLHVSYPKIQARKRFIAGSLGMVSQTEEEKREQRIEDIRDLLS